MMALRYVVLVCLTTMLQSSRSANILAVLPLDIPSHHRFSRPILHELAIRGHEVTVVTPIRDPEPPPNYVEILVPRMRMWDAVSPGENSSMLSPTTHVFINSQMDLRNRTLVLTDFILRSQPMRALLDDEDRSFDLIICELFHIQPFLMLSHVHKAPIVALSAFGHGHFINQQMGNPYELSYSSHENLNLPSKYKLFDRLRNTFWTVVDLFERDMWNSEQNEVAKRHFEKISKPANDPSSLPSLKELERNVSLVLINTHFSIDTVRPNVPGIVEVAGVHIKPPRNLSSEVQKFLDEAKTGAVYVNLESDVLKSEVSVQKVQMFNKVFRFHKDVRFVWQRENDDVSEKMSNVLISTSVPQNDALAHENMRVFVTHGGQLNVQEAIARKVPIVCIPMYGDQFSTCTKAKEAGFAEVLSSDSLCENSMSDAIHKILNNDSYKESVSKLSVVFEDKPNPPLYTATYWVEYVLKHKGAAHMKSPALKLHWYEYYLMDSIAMMVLIVYYFYCGISWMFWNVVLRKKIPRDDIQHLIEKQKAQ